MGPAAGYPFDGQLRELECKDQSMPLIPDSLGFQRRLGNLPITTYQAGERVLVSGSRTERLKKEGALPADIDWPSVQMSVDPPSEPKASSY
jgi:hypothetical protein